MNADKSLEEVWKWKDEIYKETKHLSLGEFAQYIRKQAERIHKKYNLNLPKAGHAVSK